MGSPGIAPLALRSIDDGNIMAAIMTTHELM
jgi:hypothetical protein